MSALKLTETERVAKDHFIKLMTEALHKPCDSDNGSTFNPEIPSWYDEEKLKRGQKYYFENRFGITSAHFYGLLTMFCEPRGLSILSFTGKSSTDLMAKKRYVSTTLRILTWYENDLTKGSKSWESLVQVRKLHLLVSRAAARQNIGHISQYELTQTLFGFMGYALLRPHLLGLRHDCREDIEGFIHFWAVVGHVLGLEDQYNICLYPLEVVEMICKILLRYMYIPCFQLETSEFKQMTTHVIDGMSEFLPGGTYESGVFITKRLAGVPGYQLENDVDDEVYVRQVFTVEEIKRMHDYIKTFPGYEYMRSFVVDENIKILDIKHSIDNCDSNEYISNCSLEIDKNGLTEIHRLLRLTHSDQLVINTIPSDAHLKYYLNSSRYNKLSMLDKFAVKLKVWMFKMYENKIGHFLIDILQNFYEDKMKRFQNK